MTELLRIERDEPDPTAIDRAAACLLDGGLVGFPTETVYGLGVHALNRHAVRRLFSAKERPANDPLIVHVATVDQISSLVADAPPSLAALAARFWPGPLSVVLRRSAEVPAEVTAGLDTVAIRIPSHPVAQALLRRANIPVAAPSANLFSRPSPTRAEHVLEDLGGRIDMILDAGPTDVGVESTVLDLTRSLPLVLRPGAVTLTMLQSVIPNVQMAGPVIEPDRPMPSPGLLERHYSPRAALTLYEGEPARVLQTIAGEARRLSVHQRVGILLAREDQLELGDLPAVRVYRLSSTGDLSAVAAELYATLRDFDRDGVDVILARAFPVDDGLGAAIQDRLRKAAGGHIVPC